MSVPTKMSERPTCAQEQGRADDDETQSVNSVMSEDTMTSVMTFMADVRQEQRCLKQGKSASAARSPSLRSRCSAEEAASAEGPAVDEELGSFAGGVPWAPLSFRKIPRRDPPPAPAQPWRPCCCRSPQTPRMRCCNACLLVLLAIIGTVAVVWWPKDPAWEMEKLDMPAEVLNSFIGVVTGQSQETKTLSFGADVSFWNPNYAGAVLDPGVFMLRYNNSFVGGGSFSGINVRPHAADGMHVAITMAMSPAIGKAICADAQENNFRLFFDVDIATAAHVGPLTVHITIQCRVAIDAMMMMQDPNKVIVSHPCQYLYTPR